MTVRVKYSEVCGHGDELYIHYRQEFCSRVGFDVGGKGWDLEKKTEKRVNGVIKDKKGGQIRIDMVEVKFYLHSSLKSVMFPGAQKMYARHCCLIASGLEFVITYFIHILI